MKMRFSTTKDKVFILLAFAFFNVKCDHKEVQFDNYCVYAYEDYLTKEIIKLDSIKSDYLTNGIRNSKKIRTFIKGISKTYLLKSKSYTIKVAIYEGYKYFNYNNQFYKIEPKDND